MISITISIVSLVIAIGVALIQFLNFKRFNTKVKIRQIKPFKDNFITNNTFINQMALIVRENNESDVYVVPEYIIFIELELINLSHQYVSLTEFKINDYVIPESLYATKEQNNLALYTLFDRKNSNTKGNYFGRSEQAKVDEKKCLKPIIQLDAKEVKTGYLAFRLFNEENYNIIKDGYNELTIKTTDKDFTEIIEIEKTLSKTEISSVFT